MFNIRPKAFLEGSLVLIDAPSWLKDELWMAFTFPNPDYLAAAKFSPWGEPKMGKEIQMCFENVEHGEFFVPRGVEVSDLSKRAQKYFARLDIIDHRVTEEAEFPPLLVTPNAEQQVILNGFKRLQLPQNAHRNPFGVYLYIMPTSSGKTICSLLLAKELGLKTLVLFVTNLIKKSWIDDLSKALGIGPKEFGLIQAATWRIGDCITLASVSTIARRKERWKEINDTFGCVMMDEVQRVTAQGTLEFVEQSPALFRIGSTATDKRGSIKRRLITGHFGNTKKRLLSTQSDTASSLALKKVHKVFTNFDFPYKPDELTAQKLRDMSDALIMDEQRNALIVKRVCEDWNAGRRLLIVTKRIPHIHLLHDMLIDAGITDVNILTGTTNGDAQYTKALIQAILDGDTRCIIASQQAVLLGANLNTLDTLHLVMPIKDKENLEQIIGRVRRRSNVTNKNLCEMVYYLDSHVPYYHNIWKNTAIPVFRKLKLPDYVNLFVC